MRKILELLFLTLMALPLRAQLSSGTIGSYSLSPEAGTVTEIESVRITFHDTGWRGLASNPDLSGITLKTADGPEYKVVKAELDPIDYTYFTLYFGTEADQPLTISDPGIYTLTIPEGVFSVNKKPEKTNALITAEYTIAGAPSNSLSNYQLTPSPDEAVGSLSAINVEFPDAAATGISLAGTLADMKLTADGTTYVCLNADIAGNKVALSFGNEGGTPLTFLRPGNYFLSIPKGMFIATGTEESNAYQLTATYHLENPDFNPFAKVTTSPENNATVASFKTLTVTFPEADKGLSYPSDLSGVKLTINGKLTDYMAGNFTMAAPYNNISFSFSASQYGDPVEFTESGNYLIEIPAGVFCEEDNPEYKNSPISISFKVDNPEDTNPFRRYSAKPADGATVGEIYELTISFPLLSETGIQWPFDISKVTLQRVGDETLYTGNSAMLSKNCDVITGFSTAGNELSDKLHFRTPGEYVVTIPAGTFASEANPELKNREIVLHYTVDAAYNFTCALTPESGTVMASLPEVKVAPVDVLTSVGLVAESNLQAKLTAGSEEILLTASEAEGAVLLTPASQVGRGEWTLTIPAHMLTGVNTDELHITNAEPITATYTVKAPQQFDYSVSPAEGETLAFFSKFTVSVAGSPKKVTLNTEAGQPTLARADKTYELTGTVSGKDVMFAVKGGASLEDGEYTVAIPEGYIVTTDADKLQASLPAITSKFKIVRPAGSDYDEGMLIYNEGWYGHDMASFTHVATDGTVTYNAFMEANPSRSLGLTGSTAVRFGDKLYAVAKQSGKNLSGVEGGVLTQIDAASLTYIDQVVELQKGEQARSFCGVNEEKGYLSTSAGIYPVDLATLALGERISAAKTAKLQHGDMLRYRGRVFAAVKDWDLIVINPEDDSHTDIPTGPAVKPFVTPDGSLYVATLDEEHPFCKIDPVTLEKYEVILNAGEYKGRTRIANIWSTWTPAPLAVDKAANVIYYATEPNATSVARLNLDNGEFTPEFIKLPELESGQQCLYGQGISVDPRTGEILLTAVEKGYGTHYTVNHIYKADPATGAINFDSSVQLSKYYWFPSMIVYCGYKAPELDLASLSVAEGNVTLNLFEHTKLAMGNVSETEYTMTSSAPSICEVEKYADGIYRLTRKGEGEATLTVTADYQGLISKSEILVSTTGVSQVGAAEALVDVYTPAGILVLRQADREAISRLPQGIYIAGGKKIVVR